MKLSNLEAVFGALHEAGVRYLVAGGVAVNAHGYQRMTQHLDLVLDLSPWQAGTWEGSRRDTVRPITKRDRMNAPTGCRSRQRRHELRPPWARVEESRLSDDAMVILTPPWARPDIPLWALTNLGEDRGMTFLNIDKRGRSTLPEDVRRDLGIEGDEGALIILEKTERGTYELVPAALVPRDQLWIHHPEMRDRIEEAESDFRSGRSTRTETLDETQEYLDSLKG